MAVTFAKWLRNGEDTTSTLRVTIDGAEMTIPADPGNRHYREVQEAVADRALTIQPADPVPDPGPPVLSPRQFEWLLAYSALENVWAAVRDNAKGQADKRLYADLRAQERASAYLLEKTLAFKNSPNVQAAIAKVAPNEDLSDTRITALWHEAAAKTFDTIG